METLKSTWMKVTFKALTVFALTASVCAWAGGGGTGGGNSLPEGPLSAWKIKSLLEASKEPTFYVLRALEQELDSELKAKFFKGSKTIYDALREATFDPISSGGCAGVGDQPSEDDANALKAAPKVCFSLELLTAKLRERSGPAQLMALIVHELVHLAGGDEAEARLIQERVLYKTSDRIFDIEAEMAQDFRMKVRELQDNIARLSALKREGPTQLCMGATAVSHGSFELNNRHWDLNREPGILIFNGGGNGIFSMIMMKAINLTAACFEHSSLYEKDLSQIRGIFAGKNAVSPVEFYKLLFKMDPANVDFVLPQMPIRKVAKAGKAWTLEVDDLVKLSRQLDDNFYRP